MAIKKRADAELRAGTPEKLFPLLRKTGDNSDTLWPQQVDLLREYAEKRVNAKDLAIELPTGTGKTLTGLLIADWRRREGKGRSIFVCPTRQLVRQVVAAAEKEGIDVVDLSGPSAKWDPSDKNKYVRAKATAVVPYSSIFNTSPKLIEADVIVFDDAHAGEQYVSKAYTVEVPRHKYSAIWSEALEAVAPLLPQERYHQLIQNAPGAGTRELVDALVLARKDEVLPAIARAFSTFAGVDRADRFAASQKFAYDAIEGHLAACILYVSWSKIEARPLTPPTFENPLFSAANQRVYLSATLGTSGELERAFGRPAITRLQRPDGAPTPNSGRRFLVFPHLVPGADPEKLTKELIKAVKKSIIITPSDREADAVSDTLVPKSWTVYRKDDVDDSFDDFAASTKSVAILANRYDGIDLPGDACRSVTMAGYPGATNLQERFYASRARAAAVSAERVRSRVVQGIGRCTRGPRDWALVIVADKDTTTYLSRSEVRATLSPDLQAEIEFGLDQSDTSVDDVRENVEMFLKQGKAWFGEPEDELTKILSTATQVEPRESAGLAEAAKFEVEALESMWHENWKPASEKFHLAASALSSYPAARGYQATLFFQAAVTMDKAARDANDAELATTADALALQALNAAKPGTWMASALPFEGRQAFAPSAQLLSAATRLSSYIDEVGSPAKLKSTFEAMLDGLSQVDHKAYEPALTQLGLFLGADAFKPKGNSRTDSAWCWDDTQWISVEAKSEHKSDGVIGVTDTLQVNGHLALVAEDRQASIPDVSAAVMVSPRTLVHKDAIAVATDDAFRVTPEDIRALATETERMWVSLQTLRGIKTISERTDGITKLMRQYSLRPEDIFDRLTGIRIGDV
ncbi:DEAD/DEAH box helicase family protein [Microbacterium sp. p3-SID338]|uniref:DEAD/DEAH box helicase family protein n=1 Tax=Microbacterium sp. p3-SID338 TaxID=2916214 RepID=UPI0021A54450|nr:DEAD/DEAH box helicase family protein [Microbacterium sp. p3-SID338]MCT1394645.1 DEAD/DEAH box helicase family protein [Microbacterium sp. p3-SID338]